MELDKLIEELIENGQIKKENIMYKPREDTQIKKFSFWFNATPVSPRWDGEIWYADDSHQRIAHVSTDTMKLIQEYAIQTMIEKRE